MSFLVDLLWGYHVLALILFTGIRLTLESGFFQVRHFWKWMKYSLLPSKNKEGISPFAALSTALAGSIGTGNIVGVAAAISVGGAGAIFWMWISAFFGMMTVFTEVRLSAIYKNKNKNSKAKGAFAYIETMGKVLPFVYGVGCVFSSLTMGNMAQTNAVAVGLNNFGVPLWMSGIFLAVVLFLLSKKGLKGVSKVTEKLVPVMTILFFVVSVMCLVKCRDNIPSAFKEILSEAFTLKAGVGGGMFLAVKTGISRGVFTNEAGLGSSSMAFCQVEEKDPVKLGYLGIFQVFIDTIVMCLITSLCILCATSDRQGEYLVLTAFSNALGNFGMYVINICMILFAFATTTATSYYGKVGLDYISKGKLTFLFPYLFGICAFLGATISIGEIFEFCDAFNGLMAIPNMLFLCKVSGSLGKDFRK